MKIIGKCEYKNKLTSIMIYVIFRIAQIII